MVPLTALLLLEESGLAAAAPAKARVLQNLALVGCLALSLTASCRYLYGVKSLDSFALFSSMAVHTPIGLIAACLAYILARPNEGMTSIAASDSNAGFLLRTLIPTVVALPIILGVLMFAGETANLYDVQFGVALLVLGNIGCLSVLTMLIVRSSHGLDQERQQAQEILRQSEERFRLAMNNVAAGLYTLDLQGLVTYVNPAAETILGWTNAELLGRKMHDLTHYKYPDGTPFPASDCPGLQVLQKGTELRESEDMFIRKDGSFFPVVYSASPLKKGGQTVGIVVGFRDDTQRRQAEHAVRESEERFRRVANTAPVMIWMSGVDRMCTYFNTQWLEFTGRSLNAEMGSGWSEGVHAEDLPGCLDTYIRAFDQRKPFQMEYRLRRYDGEYRWILDSGVPRVNTGSFAGYIGSAIDVTERKLAEVALSMMGQRLLQAQEEERRWLARELHDDIGQRLTVLTLSLAALKAQAVKPEVQNGIAKAIQDTVDLGKELRALSHRLHSSNLEELGLVAAASAHCKEQSTQHKIAVDFHSEGIPKDLTQEISLCLFRVLQEALQNATKHSGSDHFKVSLKSGAHEIELTVHDSGLGFEPEEEIKGRGLGLTSMKERLKLVGGQLSIDSKLGKGTTIQARVPLRVPK